MGLISGNLLAFAAFIAIAITAGSIADCIGSSREQEPGSRAAAAATAFQAFLEMPTHGHHLMLYFGVLPLGISLILRQLALRLLLKQSFYAVECCTHERMGRIGKWLGIAACAIDGAVAVGFAIVFSETCIDCYLENKGLPPVNAAGRGSVAVCFLISFATEIKYAEVLVVFVLPTLLWSVMIGALLLHVDVGPESARRKHLRNGTFHEYRRRMEYLESVWMHGQRATATAPHSRAASGSKHSDCVEPGHARISTARGRVNGGLQETRPDVPDLHKAAMGVDLDQIRESLARQPPNSPTGNEEGPEAKGLSLPRRDQESTSATTIANPLQVVGLREVEAWS